ncbi:MAG: hypothetical protein DRN04_10225 [Thermoprotei archaeon]|nr:MAG: hypothetical protein DRN04_10225 [Thermoprotei archaeon]
MGFIYRDYVKDIYINPNTWEILVSGYSYYISRIEGYEGWLLMLDSTGGIKWSKYYRYTTDYTHTWFHRIYVDPGNKIYTVGTIWSKTDNLYHAMLARMNYSGGLEQMIILNIAGHHGYMKDVQLFDGYIYAVGYLMSPYAAIVLKLNASDLTNVIWSKSINGIIANELAITYNGTHNILYIAGKSLLVDANGNLYVAKLVEDPNTGTVTLEWVREITPWTREDYANDIDLLDNGDIVIVGVTKSTESNGNGFIAEGTPDGILNWIVVFGTLSADSAFKVKVSGNYIYVAGTTNTTELGLFREKDMLLAKLDVSGNVLYFRSIGGSYNDTGSAIDVESGAIVAGGLTVSFSDDPDAVAVQYYDLLVYAEVGTYTGNLVWTDAAYPNASVSDVTELIGKSRFTIDIEDTTTHTGISDLDPAITDITGSVVSASVDPAWTHIATPTEVHRNPYLKRI